MPLFSQRSILENDSYTLVVLRSTVLIIDSEICVRELRVVTTLSANDHRNSESKFGSCKGSLKLNSSPELDLNP